MTDISSEKRTILPLLLESVSYAVDNLRLIKDFACEFQPDRRYVIIGPNGAGKSLLLKLCNGLIEPTEGQISWLGPSTSYDESVIRRRQAMVFQRPVMLRRSVAANIEYALKFQDIRPRDRREIIQAVLKRTGLRRRAEQPARILSGGEQQRLALARAWATSPEILFLDEPTANLDPAATHVVEDIIRAIHESGTTIVMTSHDLGQAKRTADEILFLHRGRLLEQAPTEQFFENPRNDLAQAFIRGELLWWTRKSKGARNHTPAPPK